MTEMSGGVRMKRRRFSGSLLLLGILALPASGLAQTIVPGGTIGDTNWDDTGSPYLVQGDLTVVEHHLLNFLLAAHLARRLIEVHRHT